MTWPELGEILLIKINVIALARIFVLQRHIDRLTRQVTALEARIFNTATGEAAHAGETAH